MGAGTRGLGGRQQTAVTPATSAGEYIPARRKGTALAPRPTATRGTDKLSDRAIAAWIKGCPGKLFDGGGLYLNAPDGRACWYVKFRHAGKESTYSIGAYGSAEDEYTLKQARDERAKVKAWLAAGLNPNVAKKATKAQAGVVQGVTFRVVAAKWLAKQSGWSESYRKATGWRLERDLFPTLGDMAVGDIEPQDVLRAIESIHQRGAQSRRNPCHEQARKCRQIAGQVMRYAISIGAAKSDPASPLREATQVPRPKHRATIPLKEMPKLFAALAQVPSELPTKLAITWVILTACRTGEMRFATWGEINIRKAQWEIAATRMKMRDPHIVLLSTQAQAVLERAQEIRTGSDDSALLFPGYSAGGALSENALLALLARAGFFGRQSVHGFRGAFSTWAHEEHEALPDVIELALSHHIGGVRGAYNHSKYLPQRRDLLQAWADQCTAWGMRLP